MENRLALCTYTVLYIYAKHCDDIISIANQTDLALRSSSPVFSFLFKIKGKRLETTIIVPLLLHADRLALLISLIVDQSQSTHAQKQRWGVRVSKLHFPRSLKLMNLSVSGHHWRGVEADWWSQRRRVPL